MAKLLSERRGPVTIVTINRADVHNCVDGETAAALATSIDAFARDPSARVLVVTGAGEKSFCSGADLKLAYTLMSHEWVERAGPMGFARLEAGKPTVAAVNGYCFAGGFELAAWCDFRIGAESVTTRSSSVWPSTIARLSASRSTIETISPRVMKPAGSTTFIASLSSTSCPSSSAKASRFGWTWTRIARPSTRISAVPSLFARPKIP